MPMVVEDPHSAGPDVRYPAVWVVNLLELAVYSRTMLAKALWMNNASSRYEVVAAVVCQVRDEETSEKDI